jgi:thiamine phosphate synthase YjbQ (UPF0047 family)
MCKIHLHRNDISEDKADTHMKRYIVGREGVVAVANRQLDFGPR